jgi:2-dehydro-3-deoxyglucarate aldolase
MTNHIRTRLEAATPVLGVRIRSFSPVMLELLGRVDVDYAYLDLEHGGFSPYDAISLHRMQMVADRAGVSLVVRTPGAAPSMVRKVLDAGIQTVIIPRIETVAEVQAVMRAAHFEYEGTPGERGFGSAPGNRWGVRPDGYTDAEDRKVLVGLMIETTAALEDVQAIVGTTGVGFVKIGTGDLGVSLGVPQDETAPRLTDAIGTIEAACRAADVPLGCGVSDISAAQEALDSGYLLVDIGGDAEIFVSTLSARLRSLRH